MNVLIVAEKPSVSRALAPIVRQNWPLADITFVHAVPYGNFKYAYPRGLKMSEYPTLSEPRNKLSAWDDWSCPPVVLANDGDLKPTTMRLELFKEADIILFACDPGHTGAVSFDVLMREVFGDNRALQCPALILNSLVETDVDLAFRRMSPFKVTLMGSLEYGRMKRYFDWNWNVNGLALIGEAQRRAGVSSSAEPVSKYALQVLYVLRSAGPMTEGSAVGLMARWPGTGRYAEKDFKWFRGIGSAASRGQILENLLQAGLLELVPGPTQKLFQLSSLGAAFLDLLHPDCEDPDLPFRLHAWCLQGIAAKPAVDRYLNTFFGKQKRFLAPDTRR